MFREELSPFLRAVLDNVARLPAGIAARPDGLPEDLDVRWLARRLCAPEDDVREALLGLRAAYCLVEHTLAIEGVEPLARWTVHPQCAPDRAVP